MNASETALVTGASGHIGGEITRQLVAEGRQVRAFVRSTSHLAGLRDQSGKILSRVEVVCGNILNRKDVEAAVRGCSVVYHAAAIFKTRLKDESEMTRTNIEGTRHVLEECARAGTKRILYTSSVAAVGCVRRPDRFLDEDAWNSDPIDAYVSSKTASEHLAHELALKHNLPIVFLNPGTVLGRGDYGPTPSNGFIALAMKRPSPVYFNGGHSYTDVHAVAAAHLAAERLGRTGERYILAGDNVDMATVFAQISALTGCRKPWLKIGHAFVTVAGLGFETIATLTRRPPLFTRKKAHKLIDYYGYFDSSKAKRELGYQPPPFERILAECLFWYRQMRWI